MATIAPALGSTLVHNSLPSCCLSPHTTSPFLLQVASLPSASHEITALADCWLHRTIAIGFDFTYYSRVYSMISICSSGFITFTTTDSLSNTRSGNGCCAGHSLPDVSLGPVIAPFWSHFNPSSSVSGPVRYATVNTGGVPTAFVVEFDNVPASSAGPTVPGVTWQLSLNRDGSFDIVLQNCRQVNL